MTHDHSRYDETDSLGAPMIRLNFREWEYAPQFEYLKEAPTSEGESCETIGPDAIAIERQDVKSRFTNRFIKATYSGFDEFKKNLENNELLFFHIFSHQASSFVLKLLSQ